MESTVTNKLGTAPIGKLLADLALPSITAQIINMLYNIVDRIYIGHIEDIGPLALTGVGLTFPIIMIITAFSSLIGMGGSPRASMKLGEKNQPEAEKILGNCFSLLIVISIILTVFFFIFSRPLLFLFGASSETIDYGTSYMNIYVLGTVFVMISLGMNPFISAQGFAKISMLTVTIGAVINIILDPIFIFLLNMGVPGAALATIISQGVSCLWVLKFLTGKRTVLKLKLKFFKFNRHIISSVLALGFAPFIMQSTESLLNICFNTSLQRYGGDLAVGAMTILSSMMQIYSLPITGLTQGAQPIISYNYGAKNIPRVRKAFRLLITIAVSYSFSFWLLNMIFPQLLVSIFSSTEELTSITSWSARIYFAGIIIMGVQNSCQQTFIALGQAKKSIFLALFRKIILLIPLIFILPLFIQDKVFAVFLAEPISDIIAATTTGIMFFFFFKKKILKKPEM